MTQPADRPSIRDTRRAQVFPRLDARQLADLEPLGVRRHLPAGTVLFHEGERHGGMFVVLQGAIEITRRRLVTPLERAVAPLGAVVEEVIAVHEAGQFTGEVGMLAGRGSLVSGQAREASEVLFLDEAALRRLMVTHADLSELIMRAFILRRVAMLDDQVGATTLIGSHLSGETHALRQFLTRNGQPHTYLDADADAHTAPWLARYGLTAAELPVAITGDGQVLRRPTIRLLADAIGLGPDRLDGHAVDLAVIGAGPAGLAAAVYAASEGLSVVVLDARAPGGQAGSSSKIENYFGFPTGISGQALAGRGFTQAQKFGADVAIPREVVDFDCAAPGDTVVIADGGERLSARCVVIATGARYRKPELAGLERFEGRGVYYGASFMEAQLCAAQEVIVVGGGNSAGQAAVFLAGHARHVHVLVRSHGLAASMSDYLIQRIAAAPAITLHTHTEITALHGDETLRGVTWRDRRTGAETRHAIEHVFLFLGAVPSTGWLTCLALDAAGFIKTGADLGAEELAAHEWPLARPPMRLETSHPGVFAVGDVRSGSVKRVAAAVGEGSTAVQLVHAFLAEARR